MDVAAASHAGAQLATSQAEAGHDDDHHHGDHDGHGHSSHGHSHGGHGHSHDFGGKESVSEMLAGGVAGLSEHAAMFPFDTIKTRMQQCPDRRGFVATLANVVKNEPLRNLWRGCGPVLSCSFPAHAAYFSLYENTKRLIGADSSSGYVVASFAATVGHDSVSVPFDVVKQHMQIDGHRHHNSSLACLRCIIADHGAIGLFRALPTTVAMNVPHMAAHWVVYEEAKVLLGIKDDHENNSAFEPRFIVAGFFAGASAACVSTPFDVVKTRLQLQKSPNFSSACRDVYASNGLVGFSRGMIPRICSLAPSAAVVMGTYEAMKRILAVPVVSAIVD
jgi:solute carrier family 25 iron transporter 28/37